MDPDDAWPDEADETNNAAVWNREVEVLGPVPCGCRIGSPPISLSLAAPALFALLWRGRSG